MGWLTGLQPACELERPHLEVLCAWPPWGSWHAPPLLVLPNLAREGGLSSGWHVTEWLPSCVDTACLSSKPMAGLCAVPELPLLWDMQPMASDQGKWHPTNLACPSGGHLVPCGQPQPRRDKSLEEKPGERPALEQLQGPMGAGGCPHACSRVPHISLQHGFFSAGVSSTGAVSFSRGGSPLAAV